jgi:hypothetical protein
MSVVLRDSRKRAAIEILASHAEAARRDRLRLDLYQIAYRREQHKLQSNPASAVTQTHYRR